MGGGHRQGDKGEAWAPAGRGGMGGADSRAHGVFTDLRFVNNSNPN